MVLPLATRHWCANPRGCERHTTWRSGKKCHGFTGFSTNDARLEQRKKKETRATVMLGTDRGDVSVESTWVKSIWALCRSLKQCGKASFWHDERFPALGGHERYLRSVRISPDTRKITANQIQTKDGMRQSVIFEAGHCVQHIVTIIHHERRPSRKRFEQCRSRKQGSKVCLGTMIDLFLFGGRKKTEEYDKKRSPRASGWRFPSMR